MPFSQCEVQVSAVPCVERVGLTRLAGMKEKEHATEHENKVDDSYAVFLPRLKLGVSWTKE